MDVFCDDLAELCGRPEQDDLTREIYLAAREAGESLDDAEEIPSWVLETDKVIGRLVPKLDWSVVAGAVTTELDRNEADVVACLDRADEFFAPYVPDEDRQVRLALCLYDFAFVRIDEFTEKEEEPVVALVAREEPGEIARVERDSKLMLAQTVRWGATLLSAIGIFMTGAVWLVPMVMVAWLASWMLIDKKAIEHPALPAVEGPTKQQVIEGHVKVASLTEGHEPRGSSAKDEKGPTTCPTCRGSRRLRFLTSWEDCGDCRDLRVLWDPAPDVGTLFGHRQSHSSRPVDPGD